jgi:hypothetical protein
MTNDAAGVVGLLFDFTETGNPVEVRRNFQRNGNARLHARVGVCLRSHPVRLFCTSLFWRLMTYSLNIDGTVRLDEPVPDIIFRCCRSKWVNNTPFPLEEVANILTELLEETNMTVHLAELYTQIHKQMQNYTRIQRFSPAP